MKRDAQAPETRFASVANAPGQVLVHHGGHHYAVKPAMAEIFTKHARQIIADGVAELVVLPHSGGVELLPITAATHCRVTRRTAGAVEETLWANPADGGVLHVDLPSPSAQAPAA